MSQLVQKVMLKAYGSAQKLKVTQWPFYQDCFIPLYFGYKKYVEDPFDKLVHDHPDVFKEGDIIDVGANIGYTALLFETCLSEGFKIFAFEPEKNNFIQLSSLITKRHLQERISPVQAAVGSVNQSVDLWLSPLHPADHRVMTGALKETSSSDTPSQSISMWTLDRFVAERSSPRKISFIKVDVQGYEEAVCQGMGQVLNQYPEAVVALEYSPDDMKTLGFSPDGVLNFFEECHYQFYTLTRQHGLQKFRREELSRLVHPKGYIDLVFSLRKLL